MVQSISAVAPRRVGFTSRLRVALGAFYRRSEPVEVVEQHFNFLPRIFRWRGRLWRVRQVVRVWEQRTRGTQRARRYFRVICQDEICYLLYQDLLVGTWHLSM